MMVGVSMAAAIIICIAAFIWIYIQIQPLFTDFIPRSEPPEDQTVAGIDTDDDATPTPVIGLDEPETPTPEPTPVSSPTVPPADDDADSNDDAWAATHQIRQGPNVNFRSGPNTISQTQGALPPGTQLRFLGDEQPAGGVTWMRFDIEDGTEGWIRDIDVEEADDNG
jgi:hypothetical protein